MRAHSLSLKSSMSLGNRLACIGKNLSFLVKIVITGREGSFLYRIGSPGSKKFFGGFFPFLKASKDVPFSLQEAFCEWWYSLDSVTVELLTPIFCRCISCLDGDVDKRNSSFTNEFGLLTVPELYQELVEQPLSVLSCRTEVYLTPLISVFLDILRELLLRNRQTCLKASKNDGTMKKEEVLRAVDMRDSAVCQTLLENWSKMVSADVEEGLVQKAGSSICAFISSLFCSSPSIFRIVHFQGYDIKLIPTIVEGISLMVHFLEYFEDSLHVVELSMLPYMVVLLSNVIRRYPYHSRSLSAAQKALMHQIDEHGDSY